MMIPYPYDVIGAWTARHSITLSEDAYLELVKLFEDYTNYRAKTNK